MIIWENYYDKYNKGLLMTLIYKEQKKNQSKRPLKHKIKCATILNRIYRKNININVQGPFEKYLPGVEIKVKIKMSQLFPQNTLEIY